MVGKVLFSLFLVLVLMGCEHGSYRHDIRTPHMPVFNDLQKGESSTPSNPYWSRFTLYYDKQEMKLSNGDDFVLSGPTLVGSLGTHYRLKSDYYVYAMTGGAGVQKDSLFWDKGKASLGFIAGFNQNFGLMGSVTQQVYQSSKYNVLAYGSLQYRAIVIDVYCVYGKVSCGLTPSGSIDIIVREKVANSIIGLELNGFKFGAEKRTTFYFNLEAGVQWTLESKIESESHNSLYRHSKTAPMVSVNAGLTLW